MGQDSSAAVILFSIGEPTGWKKDERVDVQ